MNEGMILVLQLGDTGLLDTHLFLLVYMVADELCVSQLPCAFTCIWNIIYMKPDNQVILMV